jgi:enolase
MLGITPKIKSVKAREIIDSRGNPTIEVKIVAGDFIAKGSVPSGASIGNHEAKELRDGDPTRYNGLGVINAVNNVNEKISKALEGKDPRDLKKIDHILIDVDGTKDKSNLGANAIAATSIAITKLGAISKNFPVWRHIAQIAQSDNINSPKLPKPAFNIVNGGAHAGSELPLQEFMIVPYFDTFENNLRAGSEIYHHLKNVIESEFGKTATNIGDEGGFAPPTSSPYVVLELITRAINKLPNKGSEIKLIIDCAASQFQKGKQYILSNQVYSNRGLIDFYKTLILKYPVIGLEDPFGENDWEGFQLIQEEFGRKITIIGDDLLTTNVSKIIEAKERAACNGAIIKINQIGTVSEAIEAVNTAKSYGWQIIVSHRSGETCDDFIADFAVGISSNFIKAGAPVRGERIAKYNRLLEIEKELQA